MSTNYEELEDLSVLNSSIPSGKKKVDLFLGLFKDGSTEMKDLILNEAVVIHECLACNTIYRNIHTLVKHLQNYCQAIHGLKVYPSLEYEQIITHHQEENFLTVVNADMNAHLINNTNDEEANGTAEINSIQTDDLPVLYPEDQDLSDSEGRLVIDESKEDLLEDSWTEPIVVQGSKKRKYFVPKQVKTKEESKPTLMVKTDVAAPKKRRTSPPDLMSTFFEDPNKHTNGLGSVLHLHKIKTNSNAFHQVKGEVGKPSPPVLMMEVEKPIHVVIPKQVSEVKGKVNDEKSSNNVQLQSKSNDPKNLYFVKSPLKQDNEKLSLNISCPFCSNRFSQMWNISQHLMVVHNKTKEQCTRIKEDLMKKIKYKRESEKISKYKCSFCSKKFLISAQKNNHMKICSSKKLKGLEKESSENFKDASNYQPPVDNVENSISSRPKRNKLKKMDDNFVNSQTFKISSFKQENSEPKLNSKVSPKSGSSNTTNSNHNNAIAKKSVKEIEKQVLQFISPNDLVCKKCSKVFSTYSNLRRHAATHIGWFRYLCKMCKKKFYNRSECRDHVSKLHEINSPEKFVEELPTKAAFSKKNNHVLKNNLSNSELKPSALKKVSKKLSL